MALNPLVGALRCELAVVVCVEHPELVAALLRGCLVALDGV